MFCRKCGMKIEAGQGRCRNCGEPFSHAEFCGGFWGLVGEKDKELPAQKSLPPIADMDTGEDANQKNIYFYICIALSVIVVILLIISFYLFLGFSRLRSYNGMDEERDFTRQIATVSDVFD